MFQQQRENLEGPASETDFATVLAEFAGAKIDMVVIETKPAFVRKLVGHWETCEMECNARAGATQDSAANLVEVLRSQKITPLPTVYQQRTSHALNEFRFGMKLRVSWGTK